MQVNNISFGRVIAVSGKANKVNRVNSRLYNSPKKSNIIMKDVTQHYINASSSGMMAQSAQKGDKVEIYITDEDVDKVRKEEYGWDTLDEILSNLNGYINLGKTSVADAADKILKS